ncbi:alanine dehydrogenase [Tepidamorphus sp. 3E244]|uniref:alanine dehydrogenase n=1 Tax=Tepidamorphus sp. 3E244 TaxID=3385498 RepID=UPI0038FC6038
MLVGVPKETKNHEYRVGLVPSSVAELVHNGHEVIIETEAGTGCGQTDADYQAAGARIVNSADEIWSQAEMVVKVKEPLDFERKKLNPDQILFTYLHLAPDEEQTQDLIESGAICIAYETVTAPNGSLPLLSPMSEVAGRMATQVAARCLEKEIGGRGVLLGGVPGVPAGDVVILGGGMAGTNAALIALGMGATVTIVDRSADVLRRAVTTFGTAIRTVFSTRDAIYRLVTGADAVISTVLVPGAETPKLLTADMVRDMKSGACIVDVAIDQGGSSETSKPTSHSDPTYIVDDVVHYCVTNMPGAVARTSTFALNNVTLPFTLAIANHGYRRALGLDPHLRAGLNVHKGHVTYKAVADAQGLDYVPAEAELKL